MTRKLNIEIEYGRTSGGFREAVRVMQDVMREHDYDITSFRFILGKEEKFDVRIDGELVFSRRESGRVPGVEEIKGAVKARLADGAWNDVWHWVRYNVFRFWRVVIALSRRKGVGYGWRRS